MCWCEWRIEKVEPGIERWNGREGLEVMENGLRNKEFVELAVAFIRWPP
jgi:hypothetical protein